MTKLIKLTLFICALTANNISLCMLVPKLLQHHKKSLLFTRACHHKPTPPNPLITPEQQEYIDYLKHSNQQIRSILVLNKMLAFDIHQQKFFGEQLIELNNKNIELLQKGQFNLLSPEKLSNIFFGLEERIRPTE